MQRMMRTLFNKPLLPRGGLRLPTLRYPALGAPIQVLPWPEHVALRLTKNGRSLATLRVDVGQFVQQNQPIAWDEARQHVLHSPVSGQISGVFDEENKTYKSVKIQTSKEANSSYTYKKLTRAAAPDVLVDRLREAGLAGMGGAAFPTWQKVQTAKGGHTLILNGIECEPMLSCDAALMAAGADKIVRGALLLARMMGNPRIMLAIEADKIHAQATMQQAINAHAAPIELHILPVAYPQGGEKQLIEVLLKQAVPSGSNPAAQGILVQNVMTAFAVAEAVEEGKPLTKRLMTVTGAGIEHAGNYWVPIGTPAAHVLAHVQAPEGEAHLEYYWGGPLMGERIYDLQTPVGKGSSALIALPVQERGTYGDLPCIRCGACVDACPVGLMPQDLLFAQKHSQTEAADAQGMLDCIECGLCAYVCPSEIPLVHYFRNAKSAIEEAQKEKARAQYINKLVKEREERITRRKAERLAEKERKKAARQQKVAAQPEEKPAASKGLDKLSPEQRAKIERARAQARKGEMP